MPEKISNNIDSNKSYYYVKTTATLWGGHIYDVKIGTAEKREETLFQKIRSLFGMKYEFFTNFEAAKKKAEEIRSKTFHKRELRYSKEVNQRLHAIYMIWLAKKTGKKPEVIGAQKQEAPLSKDFKKYKEQYQYNFYHGYEWDPKKNDSETIRKAQKESVEKAKLWREAYVKLREELVKDYLEGYNLSKDDKDAREHFINMHSSFLSEKDKSAIRDKGLKEFLEKAPLTTRSLPPGLPTLFSEKDKKIWEEAVNFVETHYKAEIEQLEWDVLKKERREELIKERFKNPPSAYNLLKRYAEENPKWHFYTV